jgi:hypothetical protein
MILDFLIFALSNLVCEDAASIFGRVSQPIDLIDNYIDPTSCGRAGAGVRGGTVQSIHRCRTGEVRWSCASRMIFSRRSEVNGPERNWAPVCGRR